MMPETVLDKATVFDWLLHRHVHEYFDKDGRPVGEGRAQAYSQVETRFKGCPYAGSRYQHPHPMNVSALQSILPEWQRSLSLLAWLSQRYQAYYGKSVTSYFDLALISGMGIFLTDYMTLRRSHPLASHHIPVWLSGLYKVCLGFQQATFLAMMNDQFKTGADEKTLPDAKGFYAYLEEHQLLIGPEEVCGGSEEMISRAYETMKGLHFGPQTMEDLLPQLADMAIEWERFDNFSCHTSNLWRKVILLAIEMHGFGIEVHASSIPTELADAINSYLNTSFNDLLKAQSGLAVEMARITLEESGHTLDEWLTVPNDFPHSVYYSPKDEQSISELSEAIVQHLEQIFNLSEHRLVITQAVSEQIARYHALETSALHTFNEHLNYILAALGFEISGTALRSTDLTSVYGKTLRDWLDIMEHNHKKQQN